MAAMEMGVQVTGGPRAGKIASEGQGPPEHRGSVAPVLCGSPHLCAGRRTGCTLAAPAQHPGQPSHAHSPGGRARAAGRSGRSRHCCCARSTAASHQGERHAPRAARVPPGRSPAPTRHRHHRPDEISLSGPHPPPAAHPRLRRGLGSPSKCCSRAARGWREGADRRRPSRPLPGCAGSQGQPGALCQACSPNRVALSTTRSPLFVQRHHLPRLRRRTAAGTGSSSFPSLVPQICPLKKRACTRGEKHLRRNLLSEHSRGASCTACEHTGIELYRI